MLRGPGKSPGMEQPQQTDDRDEEAVEYELGEVEYHAARLVSPGQRYALSMARAAAAIAGATEAEIDAAQAKGEAERGGAV